ncbi:extracellular calcium-sensing receptor-like [Scyliorhinus canicula]|uniref:extracellular calcium-sensing receptor-like n=1 Tax=Scyliorhinus canicula TaxID=7830 RepID=UPI0018F798FD|nr:extracellular calcium-sensing receptor-like [Scyliorhinus canicula]
MQDGDVVLGGLFIVHFRTIRVNNSLQSKPEEVQCREFNLRGLRWVQTMIFTIEEINRDPFLLPKTTLGYKIVDSCDVSSEALKGALQILNGDEKTLPSDTCQGYSSVPLIIGDAGSSRSAAVSRILGLFGIPLVSYFASCACLSDKHEFPTFLRTVPSDAVQIRALLRLVNYFKWSWVGVVAVDSDYGRFGMQSFIEEIWNTNVCIAFMEFIPSGSANDRMSEIGDTIRKSSAKVIILFCGESDTFALIKELGLRNITDIQLIASEAWVTSSLIWTKESQEILTGTIGFGIRRAEIPGLREFLVKLHPSTSPDNPFVEEFWQEIFGCKLKSRDQTSGQNNWLFSNKPCTGSESLNSSENIYTDVSQLRVSYNVYKAVYAVAHAIHNLQSCENGKGPFINKTCGQKSNIVPWQLLHYLKEVKFTNKFGEEISFDSNGDPIASYDLINWQRRVDGTVDFVKVGLYDAALPEEKSLVLDESAIFWHGDQNSVPLSVCSYSCPTGTRKAARKDQPICCFDCLPCADGEISNETDSIECLRCSIDQWSNNEKNECIPRENEYLSFQDGIGITLAAISLFGACITGVVAVVFLCFVNTPIVKANNSELSFLLLMSLILCFLCSIAFIGQPTPWSCMVRHTVFGVSFVLCISCILSKTLVVLMAFKATLPASNVMKWFGPKQQRSIVFLCTLIQIIICVIWLVTSPPLPSKNTKYQSAKIILECDVGSTVAFCCVFGYIGLLACMCFVLAFLARTLPDKFNEAKFITFSMLIFFAVWVTFIPAYVSTPGKYTVAVEIFAILTSSFGLLSCIFAPKCYIILLKPEENTKKNLTVKTSNELHY